LLPESGAVAGRVWREAQPRAYQPENLWNYIDGGADLFLAYGFEKLRGADYIRAGAAAKPITVDIYDMGAPLQAFGIFAAERAGAWKAASIGAQSYVGGPLIAFRKDRYYVKVAVLDDDMEAGRKLAEAVAERISGKAALPAELARLPMQKRIADSERYVKKGALGHKFLNEVVSADYRLMKGRATLNIAAFAAPTAAQAAWQKLRAFEQQAGKNVAAVNKLGEVAFSARDSYYGEMVAACQGRFLLIITSEKAGRKSLYFLARQTISEARGIR
jgi:hypothetical protein